MGVICGGWRLLGLNCPCWVLEGLRGRKEGPEPQESERRKGEATGSSLEEEVPLTEKGGWTWSSAGQVVRVLAEDTVKGVGKVGRSPLGVSWLGSGALGCRGEP